MNEKDQKKVVNAATGITALVLLFVNVCLPALVVIGALYFIFGR